MAAISLVRKYRDLLNVRQLAYGVSVLVLLPPKIQLPWIAPWTHYAIAEPRGLFCEGVAALTILNQPSRIANMCPRA